MKTLTTDVLVIGSGFGGSVVARRLQDAGHHVTVIEKGPRIDPYGDFKQTQDPKYLLNYIHTISSDHLGLTYAEALGGGSGFYEMASIRTPSSVFEQVDPESGMRLWPQGIDRATLDPYYDIAEEAINANVVEWERLPRSAAVLAELLDRAGYTPTRIKHAERGCIGSGYCISGCIYGAKQSMLVTHLPAAEEAGALILTETDVRSIRISRQPVYRYEAVCKDRTIQEHFSVHALAVVLGGGVVGSAAILLRSRAHLPRLSRHVGRNVTTNGMMQTLGLLPEDAPAIDMYAGRSHSGVVCYDLMESDGITISSANTLPLYMYSAARITYDRDDAKHWGQEHLQLVKKIQTRGLVLYSLGMMPGVGEIQLDGDGEPVVRAGNEEAYSQYHDRVLGLLRSVYQRMNCTPLRVQRIDHEGKPFAHTHISTTHMTGSFRMADCADRGVCDHHGQVFQYPGLFVADASALPTSLAVNPSLTIMANAERIVPSILEYLS